VDNSLIRRAYRIRLVEEFVASQCKAGIIPLPIHLSIGQECVAVALNAAATTDDYIWPTYRSHAYYIDRHDDLTSFFAELLGKIGGCSGGRGGSMHLHSKSANIIGTSGIVGTNISNAVGFSFALKQLKKPGVVWSIFGDGATDAGVFYDSVNIAILRNTQTIFFIEDNNLAIRTPKNIRQAEADIEKKVAAFGIKTFTALGDVHKLLEVYKQARSYVISNKAPAVVVTPVTRWYQHLGFDYELSAEYRDSANEHQIRNKDEIAIWLDSIDQQLLSEIAIGFRSDIQASFNKATLDCDPDPSTLMDFVK
jgi:TPP-dependent pyruvate/acetoin dehydrogenase alpha subunit